MTPERINELKRLCAEATPGPWISDVGEISAHIMIPALSRHDFVYIAKVVWWDYSGNKLCPRKTESLPQGKRHRTPRVEGDLTMTADEELTEIATALADAKVRLENIQYRNSNHFSGDGRPNLYRSRPRTSDRRLPDR